MRDLAKRAVACKGWRWMPGMLAAQEHKGYGYAVRVSAYVHHSNGPDRLEGSYFDVGGTMMWGNPVAAQRTPDLTDEPTLGAMRGLLCEIHDDPWIHVWMNLRAADVDGAFERYWVVSNGNEFELASGGSRREALVNALESVHP